MKKPQEILELQSLKTQNAMRYYSQILAMAGNEQNSVDLRAHAYSELAQAPDDVQFVHPIICYQQMMTLLANPTVSDAQQLQREAKIFLYDKLFEMAWLLTKTFNFPWKANEESLQVFTEVPYEMLAEKMRQWGFSSEHFIAATHGYCLTSEGMMRAIAAQQHAVQEKLHDDRSVDKTDVDDLGVIVQHLNQLGLGEFWLEAEEGFIVTDVFPESLVLILDAQSLKQSADGKLWFLTKIGLESFREQFRATEEVVNFAAAAASNAEEVVWPKQQVQRIDFGGQPAAAAAAASSAAVTPMWRSAGRTPLSAMQMDNPVLACLRYLPEVAEVGIEFCVNSSEHLTQTTTPTEPETLCVLINRALAQKELEFELCSESFAVTNDGYCYVNPLGVAVFEQLLRQLQMPSLAPHM